MLHIVIRLVALLMCVFPSSIVVLAWRTYMIFCSFSREGHQYAATVIVGGTEMDTLSSLQFYGLVLGCIE